MDVHLFEVMGEGKYPYCGRIELVDKQFTEKQPEEGKICVLWKFPVRPVPKINVKKPDMFFKDMDEYRKSGKNVGANFNATNMKVVKKDPESRLRKSGIRRLVMEL